MNKNEIAELTYSENTILTALAYSWQDADEGRSVKTNVGQRKSLIESAIKQVQELLNREA